MKDENVLIETHRGVKVFLNKRTEKYIAKIGEEEFETRSLFDMHHEIEDCLEQTIKEEIAFIPDVSWDIHKVKLLKKKPHPNYKTKFMYLVEFICGDIHYDNTDKDWVEDSKIHKDSPKNREIFEEYCKLEYQQEKARDRIDELQESLEK